MKSIIKYSLTTFILLIFATNSFSQTGFAQDQVVKDFIREKIDSIGAKIDEKTKIYFYDASGNLTNQPNLFDDIDLSSYEMFSANLSYKESNSTQKIVFAPWKIMRSNNPILTNTKFNISQKEKITTLGVGVGYDGSSPYSSRAEKFKWILDSLKSPQITGTMSYSDFEKKVLVPYEKQLDSALIEYNKKRLLNVWKYNIGYNTKLFPVLSSNGDVNDFDSLNTYSIKAHVISLDVTYARNSYNWIVSGKFNLIWERASAIEGQDLQFYIGTSLTAKKRILKFQTDEQLSKNKDYLKSHFIPSIYLGAAYEGKYYQGNDFEQLEDGIKNQSSLTLFLDVLITKSSQFRLGFPITKQNYYDSDDLTYIGAIVQYNFVISNLN